MRCLYCDKPLALLKRLRGDTEFCSKEHRAVYQKEHNQLALARLLQAQPAAKAQPRLELRPTAKPAPPLPPVKKREEGEPERAGFITEFLREASAVSEPHHLSADPLFRSGAPVLNEASTPEERSNPSRSPKTAAFVSESPLSFAGEVRFPAAAFEPVGCM